MNTLFKNKPFKSLFGLNRSIPVSFNYLQMMTFATKMRGTVTKNSKDTAGRRLGLKKNSGQEVFKNDILVRQRGFKYKPGENVHWGKDHTLHASKEGIVKFTTDPWWNNKRTRVHVIEREIKNKHIKPPQPFMYHPELYPELAENNTKMQPFEIKPKINEDRKIEVSLAEKYSSVKVKKLSIRKSKIPMKITKSRDLITKNAKIFFKPNDFIKPKSKLLPSYVLNQLEEGEKKDLESKSNALDDLDRFRDLEDDELYTDEKYEYLKENMIDYDESNEIFLNMQMRFKEVMLENRSFYNEKKSARLAKHIEKIEKSYQKLADFFKEHINNFELLHNLHDINRFKALLQQNDDEITDNLGDILKDLKSRAEKIVKKEASINHLFNKLTKVSESDSNYMLSLYILMKYGPLVSYSKRYESLILEISNIESFIEIFERFETKFKNDEKLKEIKIKEIKKKLRKLAPARVKGRRLRKPKKRRIRVKGRKVYRRKVYIKKLKNKKERLEKQKQKKKEEVEDKKEIEASA